MPYIKSEYRPFYDDLIKEIVAKFEQPIIEDIGPNEIQFWTTKFTSYILTQSIEQQDGHFNYFLTRLMKQLNWLTDGSSYYSYRISSMKLFPLIIEMLKLYEQPTPSYFRYNRSMGMLTCCMKEFKRRYNTKAILPILFIELLMKNLYEKIGEYEVKKLEMNGDV